MSYETAIGGLADRTSDAVEALWGRHQEGVLSFDDFTRSATRLIVGAQAKGIAVGELTLAGYFQQAGLAVPAFRGIQVIDATAGLTKAVGTIAASEIDTVMQLRRLAHSEVLEGSQKGYGKALKSHKRIEGYTRGLNAGACELCHWLAKDGFVYPAGQEMFTHKGCLCHQVPAFRTN